MRPGSEHDAETVALAPHPSRRVRFARRAVTVVLVAAIVVSPAVISASTDGQGWFTWRMFSRVNGDVRYEVVDEDGVREVPLDGLSSWDRRAHTGRRNLEALCRAHPGATTTRRFLDDALDEEVPCP